MKLQHKWMKGIHTCRYFLPVHDLEMKVHDESSLLNFSFQNYEGWRNHEATWLEALRVWTGSFFVYYRVELLRSSLAKCLSSSVFGMSQSSTLSVNGRAGASIITNRMARTENSEAPRIENQASDLRYVFLYNIITPDASAGRHSRRPGPSWPPCCRLFIASFSSQEFDNFLAASVSNLALRVPLTVQGDSEKTTSCPC